MRHIYNNNKLNNWNFTNVMLYFVGDPYLENHLRETIPRARRDRLSMSRESAIYTIPITEGLGNAIYK